MSTTSKIALLILCTIPFFVTAQFCSYEIDTTLAGIDLPVSNNQDAFGHAVGIVQDKVVVGIPNSRYFDNQKGAIQVFDINDPNGDLQFLQPSVNIGTGAGFATRLISRENSILAASTSYNTNVGSGLFHLFTLDNDNWSEELIYPTMNNHFISGFGMGDTKIFGFIIFLKEILVMEQSGNDWVESIIPFDDLGVETTAWLGNKIICTDNTILIPDVNAIHNGVNSGVVFRLELENGEWNTSLIVPSTQFSGQQFGSDLAIEEGRFVIGAEGENSNQGAVYVYSEGNNWLEEKIVPNDSGTQKFGSSLAFSNAQIVAGANDHYGAVNAGGAVYFLSKTNNSWTQEIIYSEEATISEGLGKSIAATDNYVASGASRNTVMGVNAGSVSVFQKENNMWEESFEAYPTPYARNIFFGDQVALETDLAVICSTEDGEEQRGIFYICENDADTWNMTKMPTPEDIFYLTFAKTVEISNGRFIIEASKGGDDSSFYLYEKSNGVWEWTLLELSLIDDDADSFVKKWSFDGNRLVVVLGSSTDTGNSLAVFEENNGTWSETLITPVNYEAGFDFGIDMDLDGDRLVVGMRKDNTQFTNGGSILIFDYDGSQWTETKYLPVSSSQTQGFGYSLDLQGDRIATVGNQHEIWVLDYNGNGWDENYIGAIPDDPAFTPERAISVNGDQMLVADNDYLVNGENAGLAYLLELDGDEWVSNPISHPDPKPNGNFGKSFVLNSFQLMLSYKNPDGGLTGSGNVSFYSIVQNLSIECFSDSLFLENLDPIVLADDELADYPPAICGEIFIDISQNEFGVDDLGTNLVECTVTDEANNFETCIAEIVVTSDIDGDGFNNEEDCDDFDPNINPDAEEIPYNNIDEDCDGEALLSVTDLENAGIEVFPNPVSEVLYIDQSDIRLLDFRLLDFRGAVVMSGNIDNIKNEISLRELSNGMYVIQITIENQTYSGRIIKQD